MSSSSNPSDELNNEDASTSLPSWQVEWMLVAGMLLVWSFLRVPIPGVNEPHYLTKAKHFWSPQWCANDFFLTSSNPHLVFYACFGWLTKFLSLEQTAIIGRCVGYFALAGGWTCMVRGLSNVRWASLFSLTIFLLLHALGNWSGEWLVGGIESKTLAYACLFTAIGLFLRRRIALTGLMAGLAFSFHPVVGAWGILSAGIAILLQLALSQRDDRLLHRSDGKAILFAAVLLCLTMLPGLIPALQTLSAGSAAENAKADLLQVGSRLKHHLDPMTFPKADHRYFAMLIGSWAVLCWLRPDNSQTGSDLTASHPQQQWWRYFVVATLVIAALGVAAGWGPRPMKEMPGYEWRIKLLKLYPFRLADLMVPIALSMALVQVFQARVHSSQRQVFAVAIGSVAFLLSLSIPAADQNPGRLSDEVKQEWSVVCNWLKENTEEDAIVYAINEQWALRWQSDRAEYVNYKDCPQDAKGMVEWNERLWVLHHWKRQCFVDGEVSADELYDLGQQTGIDWFIAGKFGPISATPTFQHGKFSVYSTGFDEN